MELKVKEFSNNKELCKFVNDNGDYIDIETIVVLNGIFQLFYWEQELDYEKGFIGISFKLIYNFYVYIMFILLLT